jgi:hypothetical protein
MTWQKPTGEERYVVATATYFLLGRKCKFYSKYKSPFPSFQRVS